MSAALDLDLDFSHAAMTPDPLSSAYRPRLEQDPWLARRALSWGGSEVGPLLVAYGLAPAYAVLPAWVIEQAEHYQRLGIPKIVAWKAGLRARPKGDTKSKGRGNERERELLARYKATIARHRVDPRSIRHADTVPQEFFPLVDRSGVPLAVTPDAWARSASDGSLISIELKCTFDELSIVAPPWHYVQQLQAEMAVMHASGGLLVVGERWVDDRDGEHDGPIRAFPVAPDPDAIAVIRAVVTEAWELVLALREAPSAAHCRELWLHSCERMRGYRDQTVEQIETALDGIVFEDFRG